MRAAGALGSPGIVIISPVRTTINPAPAETLTFLMVTVKPVGAPSFSKFARQMSLTLEDLASFRKHKRFDAAWRECSEIRRDYLIDSALSKRMDASFTKFILSDMEADRKTEDTVHFTLEVLEDDGR